MKVLEMFLYIEDMWGRTGDGITFTFHDRDYLGTKVMSLGSCCHLVVAKCAFYMKKDIIKMYRVLEKTALKRRGSKSSVKIEVPTVVSSELIIDNVSLRKFEMADYGLSFYLDGYAVSRGKL